MIIQISHKSISTANIFVPKNFGKPFFEKGRLSKMAMTQKIQVEISSNFLHSTRTLICIRKCNKNLG